MNKSKSALKVGSKQASAAKLRDSVTDYQSDKLSEATENRDEVAPLESRASAHLKKMAAVRQSLASSSERKQKGSLKGVLDRASTKFAMRDGNDAAELAIENERLKTTITVLQQKL